MKTIEQLITELSFSLPFQDSDLEAAYKLGQINTLLEIVQKLKGYPVNGMVRGIVTEEELNDKLVEVSNG
jgi:hypothetical protein